MAATWEKPHQIFGCIDKQITIVAVSYLVINSLKLKPKKNYDMFFTLFQDVEYNLIN